MHGDMFNASAAGGPSTSGANLESLDALDIDLSPIASKPTNLPGTPVANHQAPPIAPSNQPAEITAGATGSTMPVENTAAGYGSGTAQLDSLAEVEQEQSQHAIGPIAPEESEYHPWQTILHDEFMQKDKNGDGFLSMKEITIKELLELDVDHNGFISIEEFFNVFVQKTESAFIKLDLDRDGRLKLSEFLRSGVGPRLDEAYAQNTMHPELGMTLDEFRNYRASIRQTGRR